MRIMKCPRKSDGRNVYIHFQTSVTSGWGDSTKYEVAVQDTFNDCMLDTWQCGIGTENYVNEGDVGNDEMIEIFFGKR